MRHVPGSRGPVLQFMSGVVLALRTPEVPAGHRIRRLVVPLTVRVAGGLSAIIWVHQRLLDVIPEPVRHADGGADDPAEPCRGCDGQ